MALRIVQILLLILLIAVDIAVIRDCIKNRETDMSLRDRILHYIIGFVVNFFDVLGIGSFAPTLSLYSAFNLNIEERKIGGTMNAGVAGVVLFEALLFLSSVEVDMKTLICMELCAFAGTFVGVRLNERINVNIIRVIMGAGLLLAASLMLLGKVGLYPLGGDLTGLPTGKLIGACCFTFVMGAALMFGIGNYAPCMCVVYLMGMSPICAFPIMMCMGGLCSSSSAFQSIRNGLIVRNAALGMFVGGMAGAAIAYFVVKSMSVSALTWLVIVVVMYASIQNFYKAYKSRRSATEQV